MQQRQSFGLAGLQTSAESLTKEVMIAIPLPPGIQWDAKEVGLIQRLQHLLARLWGGQGSDCLAYGGIHTREDRGLQQKVLERARQLGEQVLLHIIQHKAVGPSKVLHEGGTVLAGAQGEGGQV